MRRITAVFAGLALAAVVAASGWGTNGNVAKAHAPCFGGSHWHQHWPAHSDYWHDHGTFVSGGSTYRSYHIHQHGDYRSTRCT